MQYIELPCYPKLNVFLRITQRRIDGFHLLSSRFVLAQGALFDVLSIESSEGFQIEGTFSCAMEENTIFKAKCALQEILAPRAESSLLDSLKVCVQKAIPTGAGLGGGSANAAGFVLGVNKAFALNLTNADFAYIAQKSGADVAFFLSNFTSANISGIGEVVEEFKEPQNAFEIFTPKVFCATPKVYENFASRMEKNAQYAEKSEIARLESMQSVEILKEHKEGESKNVKRARLNDLFLSALEIAPELENIANELGREWVFSGSGSSFFRLKDS
ncbi:4-(cytidine 5'-diphospho)-2-C-methyl-D-erythritol kinase [Helicobacter himalayensis]|uniref:4-(cytidine 5'-diphospho)-2-C-methyl-D-erythritol kinase n=1 Tax=Helicobacter himalayensis TaxID=1591088 RepID=UPI003D6F7400